MKFEVGCIRHSTSSTLHQRETTVSTHASTLVGEKKALMYLYRVAVCNQPMIVCYKIKHHGRARSTAPHGGPGLI
jgi:hypothetical protein